MLFALLLLLLTGATVASNILTQDQLDTFQRDGYLYVPKFFDETTDEVFARLLKAGDVTVQQCANSAQKTFSVMETGMIFGLRDDINNNNETKCAVSVEGETSECTSTPHVDTIRAFRDIALRSSLVQASAELMQLNPATQTMRILRDVFLAKPVESDQVCDWHVDDQTFWPESFLSKIVHPSTTTADDDDSSITYVSTGINVWLAMDDMPEVYSGSMAVAPGSHIADWRFDGYRSIGQDRTKEGTITKEEFVKILFDPQSKSTCNMPASNPELREKIDATKATFDIRQGDVIFCDRLLFHRTLALTNEGKAHFQSLSKPVLNRYSIRYVPGTARLPTGFTIDLGLLSNSANAGRTLEEVAASSQNDEDGGAVWYPQVWPALDDDIDKQLDIMGETHYAQARVLRDAVFQGIMAMGSKNNDPKSESEA